MFSDERINNKISDIFKNGIIYATLVSVVFLILKIIPNQMFKNLNLEYIISELAIILTGVIIILVGWYKFKDNLNDERIDVSKKNYYVTAAKFFLGFSLLGFAIAVPLQFNKANLYLPLNTLLINLEILGFIYLNYMFKSNKIYFNYSFIENKKDYYTNVFKNILKLLILVVSIYLVSLFIALIMYIDTQYLGNIVLAILLAAVFSFISLSVIYLYISWIERLSYLSLLKGHKYLVSQLVTGAFLILLTIISFYLAVKILTIDSNNTTNLAERLNNLINYKNYVLWISTVLNCMFITTVLLQFKNRVKGINAYIILSQIGVLKILFTTQIAVFDVFRIQDNHKIVENMMIINYWINIVMNVFNLIATILIVISLVNKNKDRKLYSIVFLQLVVVIYQIFINIGRNPKQSESIFFNVLLLIGSIISVILFALIKTEKDVLISEEDEHVING
ncbi:hypothetical protein [Haploplasma axanthum]|uniref:Uncharacterized protein n=1 Tax=Haploplasma axanthum TaxID=29552 RepID=A0A449BDR0_HAPAX|nr:hypothetical protein [Haploplasma axanthum]VEU80579.1 Uncharacterised protein [Haploplasma axanthum]